MRCLDRLRDGGVGVDGEGSLAAFTVAAAAAVTASAAAVASASSKVFLGSLSRSQVGWGVSDVILACSTTLLSSSRCIA